MTNEQRTFARLQLLVEAEALHERLTDYFLDHAGEDENWEDVDPELDTLRNAASDAAELLRVELAADIEALRAAGRWAGR